MRAIESNYQRFLDGTVFGFDMGTGSIGYAVRKQRDFRRVGALLCSEAIGDLSKRRTLRRQRRTLRNRNCRRQWFRRNLAQILGVPLDAELPDDPIMLRCRAVDGGSLSPVEMLAALVHLFKRRGVGAVPWANRSPEDEKRKEGDVTKSITELSEEMAREDCTLPCQFLALRREQAGRSPAIRWRRDRYWPRELLESEFRAILESQRHAYPKLHESADWLLFGEAKEFAKDGKVFHVFHKASKEPGILGLRWARFDNRDPGLDILRPFDNEGRPQHVVKRDSEAFREAQWPVAILNFRVIEQSTGKKVRPDQASLTRLKELYDSRRRKKNAEGVSVSLSVLRLWAKEYSEKYQLIEGQTELKAHVSDGRASFSSPTLREMLKASTLEVNSQPLLMRPGESTDDALNRCLRNIRHPLVRHRLLLYANLLKKLVEQYGQPEYLVVEAARSLMEGKAAKQERERRNRANQQEREAARDNLNESGQSSSRQALLRYRLWKEAGGICPFCRQPIARADLFDADIEHLVPRALVDCNEFYNLTIAHRACNRERKRDRTPYQAFSHLPEWPELEKNARERFKGRKLELFLSDKAEQIVEEQADLLQTSYIARAVRHVSLIVLGWLGEDGRDPTSEKQNPALRFQVTNGQLTSRLRGAWGLNQVLHTLPSSWDQMEPEEQQRSLLERSKKNRGDARHHALDAMVIASTLPWLAHRTHGATDENGNYGWWTQDERERSKAANPVRLDYHKAKELLANADVRQHVSRSRHRQAYNTTLYAKKGPNTYVVRKTLQSLKPKALKDVYPGELGHYLAVAWERYEEEARDLDADLKATKGCLPEGFICKLCFSHFQAWREAGETGFAWPKGIKIPIRSVKIISVKDDKVVVPASPGTHAYVERTEYKEVRIHLSADGKEYVPVFVPWWREDKPFTNYSGVYGETVLGRIRKGAIVETVRKFSSGHGPGKYRVIKAKQYQVTLIPYYLVHSEEALVAVGLPKSGVTPHWTDFLRALGYELPHPASAEPGAPRPVDA